LITNSQNIWQMFSPYVLFFFALFHIKVYKFTIREKLNYIRGNIKKDFCNCYDENGIPMGIIIHRNMKGCFPKYICWGGQYDAPDRSLYIMSSTTTREALLENALKSNIISTSSCETTEKLVDMTTENKNMLEYYSRAGVYSYFSYHSRTLYIKQIYTPTQKQIADEVVKYYTKYNRVVVYLHGKIGVGKTFLTYLISKEVSGSFCDTFQPTDPGDYFQDLYSIVKPTKDKPLVLLLDEVDILLKIIHEEKVTRHKNVPIQIYNKITWNRFLDKIGMGIYPNLILILCSNKSIQDIHQMDASYLRDGRVHLVKELVSQKND